MKRFTWLIAAAAVLVFAVPVFAGDDYSKCEADAQTCLDHMAAKLKTKGWVGIEMDKAEGAKLYTITQVVPESPAETAGFQVGDVFAGFNGILLAEASDEETKKAKEGMTVGATVTYTVIREGEQQELTATLASVPEDVLAQWIGGHMMEHHVQVASAGMND